MQRIGHVAALAVFATTLVLASPAGAAQAPGVATFPVGPSVVVHTDQPGGLRVGVARPDGGAVLAGPDVGETAFLARTGEHRAILLVGVRRDGTRDPAFGDRGVTRIVLPYRVAGGPWPHVVLRDRAGRVLVVFGTGTRPDTEDRLDVMRVGRRGTIDRSYGERGFAHTGLVGSCGLEGCRRAALGRGDALVVTGRDPAGGWAVTRLTPDGVPDVMYGLGGTAALGGGGQNGDALVLAPDGAVVVLGSGFPFGSGSLSFTRLTRLTPTGAVDPTFHAGEPVSVPQGDGSDLVARPDGKLDVLVGLSVIRFLPDGARDPAFGDDGFAAPAQIPQPPQSGIPGTRWAVWLLTTGAGRELVVEVGSPEPPDPGHARIVVQDLGDGRSAGPVVRSIVPVGGGTSFAELPDGPALAPLVQSGFVGGRPIVRPGGGLFVPGTVSALQSRRSVPPVHREQVIVGVTSTGRLDRTVGGPARPARLRATVPVRRASASAIAVDVIASGPGLASIAVGGRGLLLADATVAVLRAGRQRLLVPPTPAGRHLLLHAHRLHITVDVQFRDLVGQGAHVTARGTLR